MSRPAPSFTADWTTSRTDLQTHFGALAGRPGLRYLEIGVFEGRTLLWMFDHVLTDPGCRAVAVDPFDRPTKERFIRNLLCTGRSEQVELLAEPSARALRTLPVESFDAIYVDGSHETPDVLTDAVLAWGLLKPGGLMAFDDYRYLADKAPPLRRPQMAIDMFLHVFQDTLDVLARDYQVVVRKRPALPRPWLMRVGEHHCYCWRTGKLFHAPSEQEVSMSEEDAALLKRASWAKNYGEVDPPLMTDLLRRLANCPT